MILTNPDEQVWNLLTGGMGTSAARAELERLKRMLRERGISFVSDRDDRTCWICLRSRRDLRLIRVKADLQAENALLEARCGDVSERELDADRAFSLLSEWYGGEGAPSQD